MTLSIQILWLFVLAIPIACVAWTVTHEEVFKEPRQFCVGKSLQGRSFITRKFFYLFTCEYCFSHYVTAVFVYLTDFHLLMTDWRGYVIAGFALVWVANTYMSIHGLIRQCIVKEKEEIKVLKDEINREL